MRLWRPTAGLLYSRRADKPIPSLALQLIPGAERCVWVGPQQNEIALWFKSDWAVNLAPGGDRGDGLGKLLPKATAHTGKRGPRVSRHDSQELAQQRVYRFYYAQASGPETLWRPARCVAASRLLPSSLPGWRRSPRAAE